MAVKSRTAEVVIYQGDHLDKIRYLERQYEAAIKAEEDAPPRGLGDAPESVRLAEEHAAEVKAAEETAIRVKVGTVWRSVYRQLADEHPPREGNSGDKAIGANALTFREVLVPAAIVEVTEDGKTRAWSSNPLRIVKPEGGDFTDDEREEFLDSLAESDMERLFGQAWGLVNGFAQAPKAALPLPTTTRGDES